MVCPDPEKIPSISQPGLPDTSSDAYVNAIAHFRKSVDVSPVRRSNLVELTFDSYSPEVAAQAANKLARDYIEQNLEVKWDAAEKASQWLQGKNAEIKAKLEKAEDDLQGIAKKVGVETGKVDGWIAQIKQMNGVDFKVLPVGTAIQLPC